MKISELVVELNGITKRFEFSPNYNLIYSQKNSAGKSTLLRLLFYALGYNVPGTKKIKFKNCNVKCILENKYGVLQTNRLNNQLVLSINNIEHSTYILPNEEWELQSLIWGTDNEWILKNILGAIYMDQEKGWTLLNRGTVIGSIHFNIEELILGLSNRDVNNLRAKQQAIDIELKKYRQLQSIFDYQKHLNKIANDLAFPDYPSELESKIQILQIESQDLEQSLKSLKEVKEDNSKFVEFIEKMRLMVRDNSGVSIPVTKETIVHFEDSQMYIETKYKMTKLKLASVKKDLAKLNQQFIESQNLINVQTEIEKIDSQIAAININPVRIKKIITQLQSQNDSLKKEIKGKITINNSIINDLHKSITKYAEQLEISDWIDPRNDYIFTSDLKSLSGAVLHKIVFSFKMAYILEIQKVLGIKLPIVLDSPSGREMDQKNITETLNILKSDFKDNQIILASIFKYNNLEPLRITELSNGIFQ
ncbi:hypothetical protein NKT34_08350 [Paenibacillus polysaccharolyticus]|uniref:hypothetical protein n=1 Tax=Paenibacillus polysaccharolyticus TaxID=582692 RepID=UPI00209F5563|nr:hypothetical protein [Paenibacillus polysaccharolyticus]MCP1133297.1 hypothetical protein [Paenibacillus polysaccharolyticus]